MPDYVTTPFSYSSAVRAGDLIFLGLHRGAGADFAEQCRGALKAIETSLTKLDRPLSSVVKVSVYLREIGDLSTMEKLFEDYFDSGRFPARMTTTTQFHDDDCLVMIEGVATARDGL